MTAADPIKKTEPARGDVKELRYYEGTVAWERKARRPPDAKPGKTTVDGAASSCIACDEKGCLPPKDVNTVRRS